MLLNNKRSLILAFLVCIITILVYLPALQNDFVNWDDDVYVYKNIFIQSIDPGFLKWMFSFEDAMWVPLTKLSHALNYAVWGLDPMGHHLTNILLHGFNAFLVVLIAVRLMMGPSYEDGAAFAKRALIAGGVTGILFGIHPLRVESVVWVTERKDVLSGFFVLLSLLYYIKFTAVSIKNRIRTYYLFSLVFFLMALMSKPMVVTLPVVLILLDIYPLERLRFDLALKSQLRVLAEKIPFIALSVTLSIVTILSYEYKGIMVTESEVDLMDRLLVAVQSLSFYLYKMVWPVDLVPIYPYPSEISIITLEYAGPLILVMGITAFCIYSWKRQKVWSVVWVYYIVTLLPVLGIIKFGAFAAADRYTYLPGLGPMLLAGLGVSWLWRKAEVKHNKSVLRKSSIIIVFVLFFSLLASTTLKQILIWKDSLTLWNRQLALYSSHLAYNNRGNVYRKSGKYQKALADYNKAIELDPEYKLAYNNRGIVYLGSEKYQEALADYNKAIELDPEYKLAYNNRGNVYLKSGKYQKALADYNKAIELAYEYVSPYNNRGYAFSILGRYQEAIVNYNKAIELDPGYSLAYKNRGMLYMKMGDDNKANEDFRSAARFGNKWAQVYLRSIGLDYQ